MAQSLAKVNIHLIFSTKGRVSLLSDVIREPLHAYCASVLNSCGCQVVVLNSVEDRILVLFDLGRTVAGSKAVEQVKSSSSRWIKTQGVEFATFSWQGGYAAFAVDAGNVDAVRSYIIKQREHHRKESFQEEYRRFLMEYGVSFDERYMWD
jgi:REP element-mobilizing transposase RayT